MDLTAFVNSGEYRRVQSERPTTRAGSKNGLALPKPVKRPRRSGKSLAWPVAAALLAAGPVLAIAEPWNAFRSPASAEPAVYTDHAGPVRTVNVSRPELAKGSSVALPATVRPWQSAALHGRVSGYLAAWHADLGEQVKAGEVLAEIDTPELDQELAQAEAQAIEAQAAVTQAKAEREEAESDLKVALAQLARVKAETALAKSQLVRREKLLPTRAISQEEYDAMLRQYEAREAEVAAAESDLARRRSNLDTRASVIAAREATAKGRASNVERLRALQGFKQIVAPFDGVVTQRQAEVGKLVSAGGEPLFVLEDVSRVRVQTNVPQDFAAQIQDGAAATISVPGSPRRPETAAITRTSESVDATSRTLLAEIELENADRRYQPGSYAQVTLATEQKDSSWTIPSSALLMRVEGPFVVAVTDDGKIDLKAVHLGRDFGRRVAVLEGIHGNERLVVNPTDDLTDGAAVEVGKDLSSTGELAAK